MIANSSPKYSMVYAAGLPTSTLPLTLPPSQDITQLSVGLEKRSERISVKGITFSQTDIRPLQTAREFFMHTIWTVKTKTTVPADISQLPYTYPPCNR
ncbi:hypothetical protein ABKN59_002161 [Abortiporus biennis]